MERKPTGFGKLSQRAILPDWGGLPVYALDMAEPDVKVTLWRNVSALMTHHWGRENLSRLARDTGLGLGTAARLKAQETSVGIDVVEAVARVFKVRPWQMLYPALDPERTPQVLPYSPMAVEAARMLDAIDDLDQRGRVYAMFIQLAEMGRGPARAAADAANQAAPAPTLRPSAAATAKPSRHR